MLKLSLFIVTIFLFGSVNSSQKSSISSDEEEYLEKSSRANSDLVSDGSSKDTKIPNGDACKFKTILSIVKPMLSTTCFGYYFIF